MSEVTPAPDPRAPDRTSELMGDDISLTQVAAVLLKGRRVIVGLALAAGFVGGLFGLLSTRRYDATGEFVPQSGAGQMSSLASLAGQFGVQLPSTGQESQSPDFYQKLLSSRAVLAPVVGAKYEVGGSGAGSDSVSLLDLEHIHGDTPAARVARGIQWMRKKSLAVSADDQTGIVTVSVTTRWPKVSYQIASALLAQVEDFNLKTRHTQAQAEREFLEGRVADARGKLRTAEGDLQTFLQNNRQYNNSPELTFEYDRLEREVSMRQQLYTTLAQSYEQARIQEVQNTPVITIIQRPIVPPLGQPRHTVLKTLLGLILGGILGVGIVVGKRAFAGGEDPEAIALKDAWADTKRDVRRLLPWKREGGQA